MVLGVGESAAFGAGSEQAVSTARMTRRVARTSFGMGILVPGILGENPLCRRPSSLLRKTRFTC